MLKLVRSKEIAVIALISFMIFCSQYIFAAKANTGNVIGFVYAEDSTTPVEGALFQVRNINTGKAYKSTKTDNLGMFKIELEQGMYVAGVNTKEGDFNFPNLIGVKANETAKVSFALKPGATPPAAGAAAGGLAAFFASTAGMLLLLAVTGLIIYAAFALSEKEAETSPFKK